VCVWKRWNMKDQHLLFDQVSLRGKTPAASGMKQSSVNREKACSCNSAYHWNCTIWVVVEQRTMLATLICTILTDLPAYTDVRPSFRSRCS
jgi:hypothetical protein